MRTWDKIVIILWTAFAVAQIGGQLGIFSGGKNAYTVWPEFDKLTHMLGAFALAGTGLRFINLPEYLDKWRYWIPLLLFIVIVTPMAVAIVGWELVELGITWLRLMPPEQMWATIPNSLVDIEIGLLSTCTICLIWEVEIKFEVVGDKAEKVQVIPVVCAKCKGKNLVMWRRLHDVCNYILQCRDCNYAVEFRVVISWLAHIENMKDKSIPFGTTQMPSNKGQ